MADNELFTVTLPCGHTLPFDVTTRNSFGEDLPQGRFQCRQCGQAWQTIKGTVTTFKTKDGASHVYADPNQVVPAQCEL